MSSTRAIGRFRPCRPLTKVAALLARRECEVIIMIFRRFTGTGRCTVPAPTLLTEGRHLQLTLVSPNVFNELVVKHSLPCMGMQTMFNIGIFLPIRVTPIANLLPPPTNLPALLNGLMT